MHKKAPSYYDIIRSLLREGLLRGELLRGATKRRATKRRATKRRATKRTLPLLLRGQEGSFNKRALLIRGLYLHTKWLARHRISCF